MAHQDVTTVVMTRDRWPDLEQTLPRHEGPVVLVDNGSSDGTPGQVRRAFPHVDVVDLGRNLGALARNVGVQRATTPFVAFADDDSWWDPGALELAGDEMARHPRLAVLAASVRVEPSGEVDPVTHAMRAAPLGVEPDLPGPTVLGFVACGAVVRRDAFLSVGGFDPVVFFLGEEERVAVDLAASGWGLAHVPEVVARHRPSGSREERPARSALMTRNRVLTAVMRRPVPVVARTVGAAARSGPAGRQGVRDAVPRLAAAIRRRRTLPPFVEHRLQVLESAP